MAKQRLYVIAAAAVLLGLLAVAAVLPHVRQPILLVLAGLALAGVRWWLFPTAALGPKWLRRSPGAARVQANTGPRRHKAEQRFHAGRFDVGLYTHSHEANHGGAREATGGAYTWRIETPVTDLLGANPAAVAPRADLVGVCTATDRPSW